MNKLYVIFDTKGVISLTILIILIFYSLFRNLLKKDPREFWTPLTFISLTFLYYTVIGPLVTIAINDTTYRYIDLSKYFSISWTGAALSLFCIHIGYRLKPFLIFKQHPLKIKRIMKPALQLFAIGFILYALWMGPRLKNIFLILLSYEAIANRELYAGSFSMYLMQGMAFFISACCLIFYMVLSYKDKKNILAFSLLLAISLFAFLISGFRFRIVMLLIGVASVYYLVKNVRIKIIPWLIAGFIFIAVMGLIEQTRSYDSGLMLSNVEGINIADLLTTGTNESRIFMATGALMDIVSKNDLYIYFESLFTAILMPIPRAFFPGKPDGSYISQMNDLIFGEYGGGVAYMNYGEAFQSFGWIGIIINGLFIGYLAKLFYYAYKKNQDVYSIVMMSLFNAFSYLLISRGYVAQALTTYLFYIIIPMALFLFLYRKSNLKIKI
jgi:oligosaccharide repeat unit polymerase